MSVHAISNLIISGLAAFGLFFLLLNLANALRPSALTKAASDVRCMRELLRSTATLLERMLQNVKLPDYPTSPEAERADARILSIREVRLLRMAAEDIELFFERED